MSEAADPKQHLAHALSDPHPRAPADGPRGERTRVATPADGAELVALYLAFLAEAAVPHQRELVEWTVQVVTHDPLRGLLLLAERPGRDGAVEPVGLAALESSASAVHGWMARLTCLYVLPAERRRGVGRWLLAETIEAARHHGLNHLECCLPAVAGAGAGILEAAGFARRDAVVLSLSLRPLYDESGDSSPKSRSS